MDHNQNFGAFEWKCQILYCRWSLCKELENICGRSNPIRMITVVARMVHNHSNDRGRTFTMPNSKQQWHINHNIKISTQAKFQQGSIKGYLPEYCDGDQVWCIQDDTRELMQDDVAIIVSAMCEPIMFEPELPPEQFGFIISYATHSVWKYTQQEEYQMIFHLPNVICIQ